MEARDLERPFHGMRRRRTPDEPWDAEEPLARDRARRSRVLRDARAYAQVAPSHAFLAGRSAAVAWGLPCDSGPQLCVGVLAPHRAPRRPGIHGVKVAPHLATVRELEGLRVTSPATTWAMLAGVLDVRELVILGDAIVRIPRDERGTPQPLNRLATIDQLRAAAEAPGRRGRPKLLRALERVRVGSMSPLETDFRLATTAAGLPEPDLDVEIRDERGTLLGIADARYEAYRVIVEVEGDHHRTSRAQWRRDIAKHAAYVRAGYEVVRLTSTDVRGAGGAPPTADLIVRDALARRGFTLCRTTGPEEVACTRGSPGLSPTSAPPRLRGRQAPRGQYPENASVVIERAFSSAGARSAMRPGGPEMYA